MPRFRVVVADFLADALGPERDLLGDIADVVALNASDEAELVGHVETADAVMLFNCIVLTNRTISRLNQCKLIVRCGVGFDNIDARAVREGHPVGERAGLRHGGGRGLGHRADAVANTRH